MQHAAAVGVVEGRGDMAEDPQRVFAGQARAGLRQFFQMAPQASAVDQFHHQVIEIVLRVEVEHLDDVRMFEGGDSLGLALEPRQEVLALDQVRVQDLDGDISVQARVVAPVDVGHPPAPEALEDLVLAKGGSGECGHA